MGTEIEFLHKRQSQRTEGLGRWRQLQPCLCTLSLLPSACRAAVTSSRLHNILLRTAFTCITLQSIFVWLYFGQSEKRSAAFPRLKSEFLSLIVEVGWVKFKTEDMVMLVRTLLPQSLPQSQKEMCLKAEQLSTFKTELLVLNQVAAAQNQHINLWICDSINTAIGLLFIH